MAARTFFVALYGGFIEGSSRFFRPTTVTRFSDEQAALTSDDDRIKWLSTCHRGGKLHTAIGQPWYADNTREAIRDNLIRNRAIPIGVIARRDEQVATTSQKPTYALTIGFAELFDPAVTGADLDTAIAAWQKKNLSTASLQRMRLLTQAINQRQGEVSITLPTTGEILRLAPGAASVITRDVCEVLSRLMFEKPIVVHVSTSDQKTFPQLEKSMQAIGLQLDVSGELPDVIIVDIGDGLILAFIEVVSSDGPITELRKQALLKLAAEAGIDLINVRMVTAFEDRGDTVFKRRFSELARDSLVWFRTEPHLIVRLDSM
jgi:hypothetical protein